MPESKILLTLTKTSGDKPLLVRIPEFDPAIIAQAHRTQSAEAKADTSGGDASLANNLMGGGGKFAKALFRYDSSTPLYLALKDIQMKGIDFRPGKGNAEAIFYFTYQFVSMSYGRPPA